MCEPVRNPRPLGQGRFEQGQFCDCGPKCGRPNKHGNRTSNGLPFPNPGKVRVADGADVL